MNRKTAGLTLFEVVFVLLIGAVAVMLVLPSMSRVRGPSRRSGCSSNLSQIGKAMIMYAQNPQNNNLYPTGSQSRDPYNDPNASGALNTLYFVRGKYVQDPRVFRCPSDQTFSNSNCSYSYDPGHDPDNSMVVVASDKKGAGRMSDNHGPNAGQNCLMAGGNVEFRDDIKNDMGRDENQVHVIDTDIFSLTPALPRELDSYLRQ